MRPTRKRSWQARWRIVRWRHAPCRSRIAGRDGGQLLGLMHWRRFADQCAARTAGPAADRNRQSDQCRSIDFGCRRLWFVGFQCTAKAARFPRFAGRHERQRRRSHSGDGVWWLLGPGVGPCGVVLSGSSRGAVGGGALRSSSFGRRQFEVLDVFTKLLPRRPELPRLHRRGVLQRPTTPTSWIHAERQRIGNALPIRTAWGRRWPIHALRRRC